ncbi:carboxy terminal-processing peptidase [Undibacterium sp.]|uniref:carboxy terminal-processing peptidase n=1 Tax=Undibacterium sp. TaxID=1914977 RepID=UPI002C7CE083|nr:carboxy terminal-processing peptidase [Undibacterium sp.]HTD03521.1 carboxy terminal-processing peptidase [Undibacterium sp.]
MKKKLLWIALAFATATQAFALEPAAPPLLMPLQQQSQAANLSARFLTRFHYKAVPLDDAMSEKIFDRYLKSLDPEKLFFVQADIDQFASARTKLDDAIYSEDLNIPFLMFNLYEKRTVERLTYARSLLKQGFTFDQQESYELTREKEPWAKSDDEIRDIWRKRVKNDWLRLKLAGKDSKAIRETLEKRYDGSLARVYKMKSDDVFQVFMNAYAMSIEPHTNYLGPKASEDFDIAMKLSLVGIGAVLQERDEYTTIRELVPGGPAASSGKLAVGDRIVGVAQGEKGALTEVMGWRIDDVVKLIRGDKDSKVVLDVLPADTGPDGKHKLITLVRDKISLEQQSAKKSIMKVKTGATTRQVGVISLPTFYQDFDARRKGDKDFKSATRDVARLLEELKKDKVDTVLIDLRNNGGGSLNEAVELTSLFIGKGPVVQQRNAQGKISIESDNNAGVVWNGPLGVLINRGSASASEIFAAAIQDYGRGLIIGEPSFGKGTVQTMVDLDQIAQSDKPKYGELKMTVAQFFRVNGGTTQLRGVTPDLNFPVTSDTENFGESSYDNALAWVQIKPADYKPAGDLTDMLPLLQMRYEARIAKEKDFQYLLQDVAEAKALRKKNMISLNEAERRKERDVQEAKTKLRDKANGGKDKSGQQDDGLQANERNLAADLAAEKARKDAKDVILNEAANVLSDEVDLLKTNRKLAARVLPGMVITADQKQD